MVEVPSSVAATTEKSTSLIDARVIFTISSTLDSRTGFSQLQCVAFPFLAVIAKSAIDNRSCWNSPHTRWPIWRKYRANGDPSLGKGGNATVRQANEEGSLGGGSLVGACDSVGPFRFGECFGGS